MKRESSLTDVEARELVVKDERNARALMLREQIPVQVARARVVADRMAQEQTAAEHKAVAEAKAAAKALEASREAQVAAAEARATHEAKVAQAAKKREAQAATRECIKARTSKVSAAGGVQQLVRVTVPCGFVTCTTISVSLSNGAAFLCSPPEGAQPGQSFDCYLTLPPTVRAPPPILSDSEIEQMNKAALIDALVARGQVGSEVARKAELVRRLKECEAGRRRAAATP